MRYVAAKCPTLPGGIELVARQNAPSFNETRSVLHELNTSPDEIKVSFIEG